MNMTHNIPMTSETSLVFEPGLEGAEDAPVVSFTSMLNGVFDDEDDEDEKSST